MNFDLWEQSQKAQITMERVDKNDDQNKVCVVI